MISIIASLKTKKILLSDGGWGSLLIERGLEAGDCPELWNIQQRNDILEIAHRYVQSGADMIETNSFGANRIKLSYYGLSEKAVELNESAAGISREAAGDGIIVLGSVGPAGKMLLTGEISEEELYEAFSEQVIALEKGGADAICIETMSDKDEALLAVKAAKQNTKLEVICTFSFQKTLSGEYRTIMGYLPSDVLIPVRESGADIIGTNCGNGMEGMIDLVKEIRRFDRTTPVLVHANAGMPIIKDGKTFYTETPDIMASLLPRLISAGADIVGGCCGTTPDHIREFRNTINKRMF